MNFNSERLTFVLGISNFFPFSLKPTPIKWYLLILKQHKHQQSKAKSKTKTKNLLPFMTEPPLTWLGSDIWQFVIPPTCHNFALAFRHNILLWFSSHLSNCSSSPHHGDFFSTLGSGAFLICCWPILFLLPCIYTVLFQSNYAPWYLSLTTGIILCLSATWWVNGSQKFSPININLLHYKHCIVQLRQSGSKQTQTRAWIEVSIKKHIHQD